MAAGGRREEIDARFALWERDLERLRVALANASDTSNAKHHPAFVELCRRKEIAKSHWEAIRGVYRPEADAVRRCEEALTAMEALRPQAEAILGEVLPARAD